MRFCPIRGKRGQQPGSFLGDRSEATMVADIKGDVGVSRGPKAGRRKATDFEERDVGATRYRPRIVSIPESTSSSLERGSLPARAVRNSLSILRVSDTLA